MDKISEMTWKEVCSDVKVVEEAHFTSDCILDDINAYLIESEISMCESVNDLGCTPVN
jgi:hypothetical protein